MPELRETISRKALLNLSSNYSSVSEALMELIDNPFDYRDGRHITIDVLIDKEGDRIFVRDSGGAGMNDETLRDWLLWGDGHTHNPEDIGQFHIGGKLAPIFLAQGLQITCRRDGESDVWHFEDHQWGTREEVADIQVEQLRLSPYSWAGRLPDGVGFVQIVLSGLKQHRNDITILRNRIADTYRPLIVNNDCTIRVGYTTGRKDDYREVEIDEMPWSDDVPIRDIGEYFQDLDLRIEGRIGALDRDRLPRKQGVSTEPGIRTDFNGRKITGGERFGENLIGRGSSLRLYGEISISGTALKPSQNKTSWDRDSDAWNAIDSVVKPVVRRVIADLNKIAGHRDTTLTDIKRTAQARKRVGVALRRLRSSVRERSTPEQALVRHITKFADDMPEVSLAPLGKQAPRTEWQEDADGLQSIAINSDHPLCRQMSRSEPFILESILIHICAQPITDLPAHMVLALLDELHWLEDEPRAQRGVREDEPRPRRAVPPPRMSALEAAYQVLSESNRPLHYDEIAERAQTVGYWTSTGATPGRTLNSMIGVDINEHGASSRFVREEPGVYTINDE